MSTAPRAPRQSAVQRAAHALREELLERGDGELLGSEDELMERLGVSRPTLRQTARLLEYEQLLTVRRGVKGGYYAKSPDPGAIAHVAAFYLRAGGTTLREALIASQPLIEAGLKRAARSQDVARRTRFEEALAGFAGPDDDPPVWKMLRDETDFMGHVLQLAANPPIELFIRILYEFGLSQTSARVFVERPERVRDWIVARDRVAQAIVAGDAEIAVLANRRQRDLMTGWLTEDFGSDVGDESFLGDS